MPAVRRSDLSAVRGERTDRRPNSSPQSVVREPPSLSERIWRRHGRDRLEKLRRIRVLFRQLFDPTSSTYTYLLADETTREAVLIDCVFEQHARDAALLRELGLRLIATLDTHCHADHVTGAWLMKSAFGSRIGLSAAYGANNVDLPLAHGDVVRFGGQALGVRATPGHTDGCLSFVTPDRSAVFTGDALLVRGAGRTDFQSGDAHRLYRSIREQLFTLPV